MASADIVEVMGGSRLEVGVLDPSILKAEPPLRHPHSVILLLTLGRARLLGRLLPRERVRSVARLGQHDCRRKMSATGGVAVARPDRSEGPILTLSGPTASRAGAAQHLPAACCGVNVETESLFKATLL